MAETRKKSAQEKDLGIIKRAMRLLSDPSKRKGLKEAKKQIKEGTAKQLKVLKVFEKDQ